MRGSSKKDACRLEDQLIVFMALAEGKSVMTCSPPSLHTRTAMVYIGTF